MMYRKYIKPTLDIIVATLALFILMPMLLLLTLALLVSQKTSPFFIQERVGLKNKIFKVIKLRTMTNRRDAQGKLLPDAQRLTKIGRLIRAASLDEIPQLVNVIKGDMSLIGPRPLLVKYLPLYNEWQSQRHRVKPGITGWAQINGRNAISWDERFELDVYYVENVNFKLDVKILVTTIKKVFKREGINALGSATMEAFKGN